MIVYCYPKKYIFVQPHCSWCLQNVCATYLTQSQYTTTLCSVWNIITNFTISCLNRIMSRILRYARSRYRLFLISFGWQKYCVSIIPIERWLMINLFKFDKLLETQWRDKQQWIQKFCPNFTSIKDTKQNLKHFSSSHGVSIDRLMAAWKLMAT